MKRLILGGGSAQLNLAAVSSPTDPVSFTRQHPMSSQCLPLHGQTLLIDCCGRAKITHQWQALAGQGQS